MKDQLKTAKESEEKRSDATEEDVETDFMDIIENGAAEINTGKKFEKSSKGDLNKVPAKPGIGRGRRKRELTLSEAVLKKMI